MYVSLSDLKTYGQVTVNTDDTTLTNALNWAEGEFNRIAGSQFAQQTLTEFATHGWINRYGWITVVGRVAPITAVSALSVIFPPSTTQTAIAWDPTAGIFLPPNISPPDPGAWLCQIAPSNVILPQTAAGNALFRWTYTAGYATTPDSLKIIILRMAWWKYKLREAPLGRIVSPGMGSIEMTPSLPPDLARDIKLWTKKVTG